MVVVLVVVVLLFPVVVVRAGTVAGAVVVVAAAAIVELLLVWVEKILEPVNIQHYESGISAINMRDWILCCSMIL